MRLSVVIPAWNLWDTTLACLQSLAAHPDEDMEVVVVDNGSTDATAEALEPAGRDLFGDRFLRVRHAGNLGFARGCNSGARAARGDLLLFLNNDTTVTPGWAPPLRAALDDPRAGAVGPLLLYPDGRCQHCGVAFTPMRRLRHIHAEFPGGHPAVRRRRSLQAVTAAAVLLRRGDFEAAGGFHEGYRNGCEDLDLCFSLRAAGLEMRVEPDSVVIHHESRTPGRHDGDAANAELFSRRHGRDVRPDLHLQIAGDGYELRLNPHLVAYAALPEDRARLLDARLAGRNPAEIPPGDLLDALDAEPLWTGGRLALVRSLEAGGRPEEAMKAAADAVALQPVPETWRALVRTAGRLGLPRAAEETAGFLAKDEERRRGHARLARMFLEDARAAGDAALAGLFADWLGTFGG